MVTRVLVVDDSMLARDQLATVVTADLGFELAGSAEHGLQAVDLAEALRPDLVTMDVRMPVMNGLTALKHIMSRRPVPVVMVSAFTRDDSHLTFDCLRCGAVDFVPKPSRTGVGGMGGQRRLIGARLRRAAELDASHCWYCRLQPVSRPQGQTQSSGVHRLLLVAGGRGSIPPLLRLCNELPVQPDLASVVVLDLPVAVVDSLALYLSRFSSQVVSEVNGELPLRPGYLYLVPVTKPHLVVSERGKPRLQPQPQPGAHQPNSTSPEGFSPHVLVDTLAASCIDVFPGAVTSVLLSGAPSGILTSLQAEGRNGAGLVQEPATSLEPEVPQQAVDLGLGAVVADPVALSRSVVSHLAQPMPMARAL